MPRRMTLPKDIRDSVVGLFAKHKQPSPYLLYRTSTLEKFVGESPHNLLPSQRRPASRKGWTVYLAFETSDPIIIGLERIVAFRDTDERRIPKQAHVSLGRDKKPDLQKADLQRMPPEFIFRSFQELERYLSHQA